MQITNDYASQLDVFGTTSIYAAQAEEEQATTTLFGSDGDSVTISDEARQLYAQQNAASESAPAAQGGSVSGSGDESDDSDSQVQSQIQSLQSQIASLQASGDDNTGEIAALQGQIAALQAQLN